MLPLILVTEGREGSPRRQDVTRYALPMRALAPIGLLFLTGCGCTWEDQRYGWGDEREEGCNTCVCEPGGTWSCERLACLDTADTSEPADTADTASCPVVEGDEAS